MRRPYLEHHVSPRSLPEILHVAGDRPWFWLAAGWHDFAAAPAVSMLYGLIVALLFHTISMLFTSLGLYYLAVGLLAGFVLVGPVLAVGLYEISQRLEGELTVSLYDTLHGWRRNSVSVLGLGVLLVLLMLSWFMLSMELAALLVGNADTMGRAFGSLPDLASFIATISWPLIIAFAVTAAVTAVAVFMMTVVSVPLLMDRPDMDVITAVVTSVRVCLRGWRVMSLWAGIIVAFTTISVLPLYLGLIVTFPLLAYASWHAYRELLGD